MRGPDFGRAEYSCRNAVTHPFQWRDEGLELPVRIPRDVLAEETSRPHAIDDAEDLVDQPSVVGVAEALACEAVRLARVARSDEIHDATPRSRVEGSSVRPDRRRIQPPLFHSRDKMRGGKGFPLHVSDCARVGSGDADSKLEGARAGTYTQDIHATPHVGDQQARSVSAGMAMTCEAGTM